MAAMNMVSAGVFGGKLSFKNMPAGCRLCTVQENLHFWVLTIKVRPPDGIVTTPRVGLLFFTAPTPLNYTQQSFRQITNVWYTSIYGPLYVQFGGIFLRQKITWFLLDSRRDGRHRLTKHFRAQTRRGTHDEHGCSRVFHFVLRVHLLGSRLRSGFGYRYILVGRVLLLVQRLTAALAGLQRPGTRP